jgi:hypothetical protein
MKEYLKWDDEKIQKNAQGLKDDKLLFPQPEL